MDVSFSVITKSLSLQIPARRISPAKGLELLEMFRKENPVKSVFEQALGSFGTVPGGSVHAIVMIAAMAVVWVKLVGATVRNPAEMWRGISVACNIRRVFSERHAVCL